MKNNNKILNIILSLTLLLQAALFQVALQNLVLCIAEDGQIALEWQSKENSCKHEDHSNKNIFNYNEIKSVATSEVNCNDIDLHFHPSVANKNQKTNYSLFILNTIGQLDLWSIENIYNYTTINFHCLIPSTPMTKSLQTSVLLI